MVRAAVGRVRASGTPKVHMHRAAPTTKNPPVPKVSGANVEIKKNIIYLRCI